MVFQTCSRDHRGRGFLGARCSQIWNFIFYLQRISFTLKVIITNQIPHDTTENEDEPKSESSEADDHDYYEGFDEDGNQIVDKEDLEN